MGYRIQYEYSAVKKSLNEQTTRYKSFLYVIACLCVCCVIAFAAMRYRNMIWNLMLPGDPEITRNALSMLSENIREGMPVKEAIEVFCKEILYGGIY